MNKIKLCYLFQLTTDSPLSIGGSYNNLTDHDSITYNDGTYFIPASSIAGCFFAKEYADTFNIKDLSKKNYYLDNTSNLFVSDGKFDKECLMDIRDFNGLEEDYLKYKQTKTGAKFDSEIISRGNNWQFYIEINVLENEESNIDYVIKDIALKIKNGLYRIGFKQNRGFGKQKLIAVKKACFNKQNYREYLDFNGYSADLYSLPLTLDNKIADEGIILEMPITLITPLCIKDYSAFNPAQSSVYYSQMSETIDGKRQAIIPGTSLNGVLQNTVRDIVIETNLNTKSTIDDEDFKNYVLDELYLEGTFMIASRTRIDRFSGGVIDGALFTEEIFLPNANSSTTIRIRFKHNNLKLIALYYLALENLKLGYSQIGGNEGIGRGIFKLKENEDIRIIGATKQDLINSLKEEAN